MLESLCFGASGDVGVESTGGLGLLVTEIGRESRNLRRGRVRGRSPPSVLPAGLAVREVDVDTEGTGSTWSDFCSNLLTRSLNEDGRALLEEKAVALTDGPPRVGESDMER